MATNNVSVAIRVRPKLQKKIIDKCVNCTIVTSSEAQIWLDHKAFFDEHLPNAEITLPRWRKPELIEMPSRSRSPTAPVRTSRCEPARSTKLNFAVSVTSSCSVVVLAALLSLSSAVSRRSTRLCLIKMALHWLGCNDTTYAEDEYGNGVPKRTLQMLRVHLCTTDDHTAVTNCFTFDHVFDCDAKQEEIYEKCLEKQVDSCFEGYNAKVLAYGQTGSGKTYSMGTGFDVSCPEEQLGIIPRAFRHIFAGIAQQKEEARQSGLTPPEFSVSEQFIEIYNEELIDLLCEKSKSKGGGGANNHSNIIRIQEDLKRGIILSGVENKPVSLAEETLACLKKSSLFLTTGAATLMNAKSSRLHAIFTLFIRQSQMERREIAEDNNNNAANTITEQELITLTAKFNFVNLADSQRLVCTGALGERDRKGISINSGFLHLGNVISALGKCSSKRAGGHIPYRDSKLTRVLQDLLGGNSVTTMIACISPCDRDSVETLSTLRYANRAKNIKIKVVADQDWLTALTGELRKRIRLLEQEKNELRKEVAAHQKQMAMRQRKLLQLELNSANMRSNAFKTRLAKLFEENVTLIEQMAMRQI